MSEHPKYKLGYRIPDKLAPAIDFSRIRTAAAASFPKAKESSDILDIPPELDHLDDLGQWQMLGNLEYNDCNAVAWSNTRRLVTANLGSNESYPDQNQVFTFYKTQNPFFDPDKKDEKNDQGMYIQDGLDYLLNHNGPDNVRALAFARVEPNFENLRTAIAIFGSVWVGLRVYKHNFDQTGNEAWTLPADEHEDGGGHAVLVGGYSQSGNLKFVTWASVRELSSSYIAGFPDHLKPSICEAYVVVWPEHIGTRRFMAGVNLHQLAEEYKHVTEKPLFLPAADFNSLYFCPASSDQDALIEIKKVDADQSYTGITVPTTTPIRQSDAYLGTFVVENGDLYFIKTQKTESKTIEVYRMPKHNFGKFDIQTVTAFVLEDGDDGLWTIDNGDLYFIKTSQTSSGMIEVHYADHVGEFKKIKHYVSEIAFGEIGYGTYTIRGGDLYLILDGDSKSGCVEVYCAKGTKAYKSVNSLVTGFKLNEIVGSGTWDIGQNGDLYLIKTYGTASGMVELYVATLASKYTEIKSYSTAFKADNMTGGYYPNSFVPQNTVGQWMI